VSPAIDYQVHIILLDIEGTTTPVDFVYQTLFPYAYTKLESFLREHFQEPEITSLIQQLRTQHQVDEREEQHPPAWVEEPQESRLRSCIAYGQWLMDKDSKCTALKALQGQIWQEGYAIGDLHGRVYEDVPPAFERWLRQKRKICIYSSGSVLAQQLLFSTIASGDLTKQIAGFFDTSIGVKTKIDSYRKIAESVTRDPMDFLFISDVVKEVEAAHQAGMQAVLCNREARPSQLPKAMMVIRSFDEIFPD
jgi:enolase-phosphatase E1